MTIDVLGPASVNAVTSRPNRSIVRGAANTWFKDCTDPQTEDGTILPADFFNDVLAQLRTTFTNAGITLDNADDMLWRAIRSQGLRYGVDTGSANTVVANFTPAVTSLYPGLPLLVKIAETNTGAATLAADGQPAKSIINVDGTALSAGALRAGMIAWLAYDGTAFQLMCLIPAGAESRFAPGQLVMALGNTALSGTVKANGALYNRADYPALWAYASASGRLVTDANWNSGSANKAAFSSGDGATTFRVPDLRGEFLRMWDDGRGVDNGRLLAAWQDELFKEHSHAGSTFSGSGSGTISGTASVGPDNPQLPFLLNGQGGPQQSTINTGTGDNSQTSVIYSPFTGSVSGTCSVNVSGNVTVGNAGGAETRPRNAAVTPCIAY